MKIKLLLIEDEIEYQQNIKEIYDFNALTSGSGLVALKLLEEHYNTPQN